MAADKKKDEPNVVEATVEGRSYEVEGNDTSDYVGASPEYRTYAEETHKPFQGDEGKEAVVQELQAQHDEDMKQVGDRPVDGGPVAPSTADVLSGEAEAPEPGDPSSASVASVDPVDGQPQAESDNASGTGTDEGSGSDGAGTSSDEAPPATGYGSTPAN
jgi:hypothetical protein